MAGILSLLILVALLGGLVLGIVLWVTGGRSRSGEMACGGCGYAVRGLEALNCPECGADLREVGIDRGKGGGSRVFGIVLTLCCGGVLLMGCLGSAFFFVADDSSSVSPAGLQAYPTQPSTSGSTSTLPVVIDGEAPIDSQAPDAIDDDLPSADVPTP